MVEKKGLGKCVQNHVTSYGYPSRPEKPSPFCSECGNSMIWACASCDASLPDDVDELIVARFCRECGDDYFERMKGIPK